MQARNRLCSDHGLDGSERYAQVTSTASSDAGPAGSVRARGNARAGPNCSEADVAVAVEVDLAPGAELVLDVLDPAPLVDRAVAPRLPPDAAPADLGPARLRRAREVLDRHRQLSVAERADAARGAQSARSRSSVTSGRARKRSGTNVVPRPGETCITVPSQASIAEIGPERGCARPMRPPGHGHADLPAVEVARRARGAPSPARAAAARRGSGRAARAARRSSRGATAGSYSGSLQ